MEAPPSVSTPAASADAEEAESSGPSYKRQRLEFGADIEGGLQDGEVVQVAPEGPAACYVCKLADVLGKFRPDKVCQETRKNHRIAVIDPVVKPALGVDVPCLASLESRV